MDYIFFDIECADGLRICSFGYVIVDENFNIIKKEDILINPKCQFRLGRDSFDPRIALAYPESEFTKHKVFPCYYDKIKELLLAEGRVACGHSVLSDISFLKFACNRYKLDLIDLKAFDTQKIYHIIDGSKKNRALHTIIEELDIGISHLCEHKSCDDAEATMLVAKKICELKKCSFEQLIKENENAFVHPKEDEKKIENYPRKFGRV